ncbi:MAG: LD-carboxypeptidase, partial [Treponema sp.]|nr:LD-carboxypeptidase [Treponema sp.]
RIVHKNEGFQLLQGNPVFSGEILGGCIESIYDMFDNSRYSDTVELCKKYNLFPSIEEWKGKILLLESSEEKTKPDLYRKMIRTLKETGIFDSISGILVGKPIDEIYYDEYKSILLEEIENKNLPIVYNINIGHATPHCIIPFGIKCKVNMNEQTIIFNQ